MSDDRHRYFAAAERALNDGRMTEGPEVDALEREFADWLGVAPERVVAVNSGTAALTALLVANGIGPGDEVFVPGHCFPAAALAAFHAGAEPVLIDVDETWGLSADELRDAPLDRARAVIAVDQHGCPAEWAALREVAEDRNLMLIEDAAPAYGSEYGMLRTGTLAPHGSAFSLNVSKQLSAGEGGLVVEPEGGCDGDDIRHWRAFGEMGQHEDGLRRCLVPGYNWKLPELSASQARADLETLDERVHNGRVNGNLIREAARDAGLSVHPIPVGANPSWHAVRIGAESEAVSQRVAAALEETGVPIRGDEVAPLALHPAFAGCRMVGPLLRSQSAVATFRIGGRDLPLYEAEPELAEEWAEMIRNVGVVV